MVGAWVRGWWVGIREGERQGRVGRTGNSSPPHLRGRGGGGRVPICVPICFCVTCIHTYFFVSSHESWGSETSHCPFGRCRACRRKNKNRNEPPSFPPRAYLSSIKCCAGRPLSSRAEPCLWGVDVRCVSHCVLREGGKRNLPHLWPRRPCRSSLSTLSLTHTQPLPLSRWRPRRQQQGHRPPPPPRPPAGPETPAPRRRPPRPMTAGLTASR